MSSEKAGEVGWVFCSVCKNTNPVGADMYSAGPFVALPGSVFELKMNLKTH